MFCLFVIRVSSEAQATNPKKIANLKRFMSILAPTETYRTLPIKFSIAMKTLYRINVLAYKPPRLFTYSLLFLQLPGGGGRGPP